MTKNDLVLYQIDVIILIWIKGMAWGYVHTFANSEKKIRAPDENKTHHPPSSSLDASTTELLESTPDF